MPCTSLMGTRALGAVALVSCRCLPHGDRGPSLGLDGTRRWRVSSVQTSHSVEVVPTNISLLMFGGSCPSTSHHVCRLEHFLFAAALFLALAMECATGSTPVVARSSAPAEEDSGLRHLQPHCSIHGAGVLSGFCRATLRLDGRQHDKLIQRQPVSSFF